MVITPIAKQKRDLTVLKKIFSQKYIFILVTKMKNDLLQLIKCTGSVKTERKYKWAIKVKETL